MESIQVFFDLDGYGRFVWPAFAATFIVMVALLVASLRSLKVRETTLAALREGGRRTGPGGAEDEA